MNVHLCGCLRCSSLKTSNPVRAALEAAFTVKGTLRRTSALTYAKLLLRVNGKAICISPTGTMQTSHLSACRGFPVLSIRTHLSTFRNNEFPNCSIHWSGVSCQETVRCSSQPANVESPAEEAERSTQAACKYRGIQLHTCGLLLYLFQRCHPCCLLVFASQVSASSGPGKQEETLRHHTCP